MTTPTHTSLRAFAPNLARRAVTASILAAGTNLTLYLLASAGWLGPNVQGPATFGIGIWAVAGMSMGPAVAAPVILAGLRHWTPRPTAAFLTLSALVFAGFFAGPFTIGAPAGTIALLETMHAVVAVTTVGLLIGGSLD